MTVESECSNSTQFIQSDHFLSCKCSYGESSKTSLCLCALVRTYWWVIDRTRYVKFGRRDVRTEEMISHHVDIINNKYMMDDFAINFSRKISEWKFRSVFLKESFKTLKGLCDPKIKIRPRTVNSLHKFRKSNQPFFIYLIALFAQNPLLMENSFKKLNRNRTREKHSHNFLLYLHLTKLWFINFLQTYVFLN